MEPLKTLAELQIYANWKGRKAFEVHELAKKFKWEHVFSGGIITAFSRVRQYFNVNPTSLTLLDETTSRDCIAKAAKAWPAARLTRALGILDPSSSATGVLEHLGAAHLGLSLDRPVPILDESLTLNALSGAVYNDQHNNKWYQTTPGGTVYHWKTGLPATPAAMAAEKIGQALVPVFKLVCPDGTGGSQESIIFNRKKRMTIGAVNEKVDVSKDIEKHLVYQGSYNYAETIEKGYTAHNRLDVKSDKCIPDFLIQPKNYEHNDLSNRTFEEIKIMR